MKNNTSMRTRTCHGIIGIGVITICASLLLMYNSTLTRTSENGAIDGMEHRRVRPTKAQDSGHGSAKSYLESYSSIINNKPLEMHCNRCALVTSSGHLTRSKRGEEIDGADCVIRMNDAPVQGYQEDVGRRTSLRVIAHSSMHRVLQNRQQILSASKDTTFIFWGPSIFMRHDGKGQVYNKLRTLKKMMPELKVYVLSQIKMLELDELFKKETGKDRRASNSWLSTGWFTMTIAMDLCDSISVYGMAPPEFCSAPAHPRVRYHYYEPSGPEECNMYLSHELGRQGSHHRFITEKRVFARWARTFSIRFYQPEWSPSLLLRNSSLENPPVAS